MSELARTNGWRGFDGIGERTEGGYEYRCDGMPSPMGCGEAVVVTRRFTRVGVKKTGWFVCYGLDEDEKPDLDVVLTFCPRCTQVVLTTYPAAPNDRGPLSEPSTSGPALPEEQESPRDAAPTVPTTTDTPPEGQR